ncbi:uncharacterized protein BDW70DRAFT_168005 [Aspergillus foveolatus]|uniref:uncharacterized protein n=1 Tax=Aspergillus foveolatus TaxID=210207 RepID=UPI003CCD5CF4
MELNALNLLTKPPRVRWSPEMRTFLCCLIKYFNKDRDAFQAIFNSRFKKELSDCGFSEKLPVKWSTLDSQWIDMKKKGNPIWGDVHQSAFDAEAWPSYIEEIKATAISINKHIDRKAEDTNVHRQLFQKEIPPHGAADFLEVPNIRRRLFRGETVSGQSPGAATPQQDGAQRFTDQLGERPLCTAGDKLCFWLGPATCVSNAIQKATNGLDAAQLPPLLYRWWNVRSQGLNLENVFVAGMFASLFKGYFGPDTLAEDEFNRLFESHIRRRKDFPSPFISTFMSLLAPVHRGLRAKGGATIAIFDTRKLRSKAYSAREFVREQKLKIGRMYNGAGEYAIWGQINNDAIICSFTIATLSRIANEHPDINRFLQLGLITTHRHNRKGLHKAMTKNAMSLDMKAGATVGKLLSLLDVPQEFCREISGGMAYSWRIKTRYMPWRGFFEGVELGYGGESFMPTLLTPDATPDSVEPIPFGGHDSDPSMNIVESSDDWGNKSDATLDLQSDEDEQDESSMGETPSPPFRHNKKTDTPRMNLDGSPLAQNSNSNSVIVVNDGFDGEMDDVMEESELTIEVVDQQQMATDEFAVDRARIMSVLSGNF